MDRVMETLVAKADRIISLLESLVIQNERSDIEYDIEDNEPTRLTPIIPTFPSVPPPDLESTCPQCQMKFKGIMGYVCMNVGCPMGVGPVTC